jgi:fructose-bisphosphate aldolase class II
VSIPLVLHGGSANPDAEIAESVTLGVGKINISSDMKYAYFRKVREILSKESWWDPNVIYPEPIDAAREVIRHKMKLFGSTGKANLY